MKLTIKGSIGKQELIQQLINTLNTLEDAGVEEYMGVNIYFNPVVAGKKSVATIDGNSFDYKYTSKKEHKATSKDKAIQGRKPFSLNTESHLFPPHDIKFIAEDVIKQNALDEEALRNQNYLKWKEEMKQANYERDLAAKETKNKAKKCIAELQKKLNITRNEYKEQLNGTGWLKTKKGVEKYTQENIEIPVFRITMNKKVFLYSEDARLMFESQSQ
jgi:hypothetical protein